METENILRHYTFNTFSLYAHICISNISKKYECSKMLQNIHVTYISSFHFRKLLRNSRIYTINIRRPTS